jgi:NADH-quinone oxidoreductase subunit C
MPEEILDVLYRVIDAHMPGVRWNLDVRVVPIDEVWVTLPVTCLRPAVQALIERCGFTHLSTLTAQHFARAQDVARTQDVEGAIELLYHFWRGRGLTVRLVLPAHDACLPTVTDLIPGAAFYEREVAEMLGVTFEGHPDPRPLLLPDDWEGGAPLRQDFAVEDE